MSSDCLPIFSLVLGLLIASVPAHAQISTPGEPYGLQKASLHVLEAVPTVQVDPPLPAKRTARRATRTDSLHLLPQQYGTRIRVTLDLKDAGRRRRLPNGGTLWHVKVAAPGARGIRLIYDRFRVPSGARFYVYDPEGRVVHGAFTARNNGSHGGFATGLTPGSSTVLEYYEPPNASFAGRVQIAAVVRATAAPHPAPTTSPLSGSYEPAALTCSINTACSEGDPWSAEARATVLIDHGGSTCSGVLLNNTAEDFSPYILTAHHCGTPAVGDTLDWLVTFNYASPSCEDPATQPPKFSMSGVVVRAAQSGWQEDYALLELLNPIPSSYHAYYAGWSRKATPPRLGVSLGHPRGDLRKIAFDDDSLVDLGARWLATFDRGAIEGGSSGGPLFDDQHRVVGHVRGAWSIDLKSCSGPGGDDNASTIVFPKLAHIWDAGPPGARISDFLDPADLAPSHLDGLDSTSPSSVTLPWINEVDTRTADAADEDEAEFIEIAGPSGLSLEGYQIDVYSCSAGTAEHQFTEVLAPSSPLDGEANGTGFFVLGGTGLPATLADQYFETTAPNQLPDGYGLLVLRDPAGRELFDYQYDGQTGDPPGACPSSRTTRSRADDYSYRPQLAGATVSAPDAKVTLGSTAIGFEEALAPTAGDQAAEGIVPSPGHANGTAMPVELTSFKALVDGATVRLSWTTASETGNAGFEVQHAMEDGEFAERAFVDGHGTTTQTQTYMFTASDLLTGRHRFRLRQVDIDGSASLSPVVEVEVASSASFQLSRPHPNPFHQAASLTLTVAQPQHVEVLLYDVLGRRVAVLHDRVAPAHQSIPLQVDAQSLSSGLYIVRVVGEQFTASRKMTLLR